MMLLQILIPAIALAPLVAGRPAGSPGDRATRRDVLEQGTLRRLIELGFVGEDGHIVNVAAQGAASGDSSTPETRPTAPPGAHNPRPQGEKAHEQPEPPDFSADETQGDSPHAPAHRSFGVSYDPYCADHQCKTKDQIASDFKRFGQSFSMVRTYGTDCDQLAPVRDAAKLHGMKVFVGVWDPKAVDSETRKIIDVFQDDWDVVDTVSVGNERVNDNSASVGEMAQAVSSARSALRNAGYRGPVVTVDTFIAYLNHPELASTSDYCAINAHPFFDSNTEASRAGEWLQGTVNRVKNVCGSKRVIVTETGWPTRGDANGSALPGLEHQKAAISSMKQAFSEKPRNLVLFSAFNSLWKKKDKATFNAEPYWGLDGAVSHTDSGWADV